MHSWNQQHYDISVAPPVSHWLLRRMQSVSLRLRLFPPRLLDSPGILLVPVVPKDV